MFFIFWAKDKSSYYVNFSNDMGTRRLVKDCARHNIIIRNMQSEWTERKVKFYQGKKTIKKTKER